MFPNLLTQLGDWNPQLFREIRGRFKLRNVLMAGVLSLLGQFCLFLYFHRSKFGDASILDHVFFKDCSIQSNLWWFDIFHLLFRFAFLLLVVLGSYLLTEDISGEARRGTLTFLRLSPQSSRSILIGKLLGVPILLYIAIALTLPLQIWAAIKAELPVWGLGLVYLMGAAICASVYSFALFYSLLWMSKARVWYVVVPVGGFSIFLSSIWNSWGNDYRLSITSSADYTVSFFWFVFLFAVFASATCWFWEASIHGFRHSPPDR
jgi:hypothetical protein